MLFSAQDHPVNPPGTWTVERQRVGRRWDLRTAAGVVISSFPTKRSAVAARTSGFYADLYAKEGRWYAGEPVAGWLPYQEVLRRAAERKI